MSDRPILIDDDDRYSRLRLIAWWDQERLSRATMMLVGVGALGNEVLKNLVLLGIGRILVVDFDTIEPSNLTRSVLFRAQDRGRSKALVAAERCQELNPDSQVIPLNVNVISGVGLGLFRDVDVVISCLDNREARLWVNRCCWKVGTTWIDGGIEEISGTVRVFVPPDGPCYECGMTEIDYQLINVRYSCPLLKREDVAAGRAPTTPTIASIVGGWQTQEAVKLLHGLPTAAGQALVYNGLTNQFYTTRLPIKPDCLSHECYEDPREFPLSAANTTAQMLFDFLRLYDRRLTDNRLRLVLDRDLVKGFRCEKCESWRDVLRPVQTVMNSEAICSKCGEVNRPELCHVVETGSELASRTLQQLGVPAYDILRVQSESEEWQILLGGDTPNWTKNGLS